MRVRVAGWRMTYSIPMKSTATAPMAREPLSACQSSIMAPVPGPARDAALSGETIVSRHMPLLQRTIGRAQSR